MSDPYLLPGMLILLVFLNRYFFGLWLRWGKGSLTRRTAHSTKTTEASGNTALPTLCVIIPLYNEGRSIYRTLKSIVASDYPAGRLTVTVVDDCSTDDSHIWACRAAQEHPDIITVTRNSTNLGKRLGIARAVRQTQASLIVSVDSDVIVSPTAITKLARGFDRPDIAAVGGRVLVSNARDNWLTAMQAIKYWVGYEFLKNLENAFDTVLCLSGCLTAYRRSVLIELEPILAGRNLLGVPIKYGEDRFLTRQIVRAGYRTRLDLSAECWTKAPHRLDRYFSQQLRWRRSNIVDFIGSLGYIWRLHPFVTLHYLSLYSLVMGYPAILWVATASGSLQEGLIVHLGVMSTLALIYAVGTHKRPSWQRAHPLYFLPMTAMLPVTYMALNVLALFTLDSGSWETRKSSKVT